MDTKVLFSSKTDLWETPQAFFDSLNKEFHFTIDVCALQENSKCDKYYTPLDDGLAQEWCGVVWCNPPYGREVCKWVRKAYFAKATVVMLLPARTDTKWFHDYIAEKQEVRFVKGRLKFGGCKNSAPFPSMVVVFRNQPAPEVENKI
jgi:site-specific DNA-methyltransferase (adenine-specific)